MALNDVYQIVPQATLLGQQVSNVFFYWATGGEGVSAVDAWQAFNNTFLTVGGVSGLRLSAFADDLSWHTVRVINLFDLDDIYEHVYSPPVTGTGTSEPLASMVAVSFRTPQVTRSIRRGQKRFSGLTEGAVLSNNLAAGTVTVLEALRDDLGEVIGGSAGSTGLYTPVIVKRVKEVDPVTGDVSYRLPETIGETELFPATTWEIDTVVTTQRSRRPGHGS